MLHYQSGTRTYGLISPLASTGSDQLVQQLLGEFAQLKISKFGSRISNVEASFYISASADGVLWNTNRKNSKLLGNTTFAIVEQSVSESMAPIFLC